jgi:hypothetical protein
MPKKPAAKPAQKPKPKAKAKTAPLPARRLYVSRFKTRRFKRQINTARPKKLPSSFAIAKASLRHLYRHKKIFLGITLVYMILTVILVQGLGAGASLGDAKETLESLFTGNGKELAASLALFGTLLTTTGSPTSEVAGAYQSILLIVMSLALIWTLRQTYSENKVGLRDAFYNSQYPIIPFVVVLLVLCVQLLPVVIANFLYTVVFGNGLAVSVGEQFLWATALFGLTLLSLYLVTATIFALYITTLPDMYPRAALRSARQLVRARRWMVLRKMLFLPVMLVVIGALIMVPIILILTPIAAWAYLALSLFALAVGHSYMYSLYREML